MSKTETIEQKANAPSSSLALGDFYAFLGIILGGLSGILISVPISFSLMESGSSSASLAGALISPLFGLIGLRVGYLRRHSRLFFYTSFLTVLLLSTMLGFSFVETAPHP